MEAMRFVAWQDDTASVCYPLPDAMKGSSIEKHAQRTAEKTTSHKKCSV